MTMRSFSWLSSAAILTTSQQDPAASYIMFPIVAPSEKSKFDIHASN